MANTELGSFYEAAGEISISCVIGEMWVILTFLPTFLSRSGGIRNFSHATCWQACAALLQSFGSHRLVV